jgi:hypothetical protein
MKYNRRWIVFAGLALLLIVAGALAWRMNQPSLVEAGGQPVTLIRLDGPIADKDAELSSLAWYGDTLILMPQYPGRFGDKDGSLFAIPRQDLLDVLDGKTDKKIKPGKVEFSAPGLEQSIPNFQGYEAIGFSGNRVYMTIEAGEGDQMTGYLVSGTIAPDLGRIDIDTSNVQVLQTPIDSANHAYESLVVLSDRILVFYEINGANLNLHPIAQVFGLDLTPMGTIPFPQIEYRVTDADLAPDGTIWVINYFFPGDTDLAAKVDPLDYGTPGPFPQVERLVPLRFTGGDVELTDDAPVDLLLESEDARNWEGLVVLDDRGFLLVTDKYPDTLLGFVPYP